MDPWRDFEERQDRILEFEAREEQRERFGVPTDEQVKAAKEIREREQQKGDK